jgi:hypothetical protein
MIRAVASPKRIADHGWSSLLGGEISDREADFGAFVPREAGFGKRDRRAAFGAVVGGLQHPGGDRGANHGLNGGFGLQIETRGRAFVASVDNTQVFAAADPGLPSQFRGRSR